MLCKFFLGFCTRPHSQGSFLYELGLVSQVAPNSYLCRNTASSTKTSCLRSSTLNSSPWPSKWMCLTVVLVFISTQGTTSAEPSWRHG